MKIRMFIFITALMCIFGLATYFVGLHLTVGLEPDSNAYVLSWGILWAAMIAMLFTPIVLRILGKQNVFSTAAFLGISVFIFLFFSLSFIDLLMLFPPVENVIPKNFAYWSLVLSCVAGYCGFLVASKGPRVVKVEVPHKRLHRDLHDLRIVQISDLHVGMHIGRDYVQKVVDLCNDLNADIITFTGDIIDGPLKNHTLDLEPLSRLQSKLGIFFVTGNHEYFWDFKESQTFFQGLGFDVLKNEHRILRQGEAQITIAGVPDLMAEKFENPPLVPNAVKALHGSGNSDYVILLSHQPNTVVLAEKVECDLQLSGHTHGGQFFPINAIVGLFNKYSRGLNRHKDKFWVHVSQGTGYWGPPNRLGVRAEISLLILTDS